MLGRRVPLPLLLLVLLLVPLAAARPATAADASQVLLVTSAADDADDDADDGQCRTEQDACTLRAALQEANRDIDPESIRFALPAGATIHPATALPVVLPGHPVEIDGTSQPGWDADDPRPVVRIDGSDVAGDPGNATGSITYPRPWGLDVRASESIVRGIEISGFPSAQIGIQNAAGVRVQGNVVGAGGTVGLALSGVRGGYVGGPAAADVNVAFGSTRAQVIVAAPPTNAGSSTANVVQNNRIGSTADGSAAVASPDASGIIVTRPPADPTSTSTGDVVVNNVVTSQGSGISLIDSTDTEVYANQLGARIDLAVADADGKSFANKAGIEVEGTRDALIGGTTNGDHGNIVVNSTSYGVSVAGDAHGTFLGANRIGVDYAGARVDPDGRSLGNGIGIAVYGRSGEGHPSGTQIGDGSLPARNLIGANTLGVLVAGTAADTVVRGNRVGMTFEGEPVGNGIGIQTAEFDGAAPDGVTIGGEERPNVVAASTSDGISAVAGTDVAIRDNLVGVDPESHEAGNETGVRVGAPGAFVAGNAVARSAFDGIRVIGGGDGAVVRSNVLDHNGRYGILVSRGEGDAAPQDVSVGDPSGINQVRDNGLGIGIIHAVRATVRANTVTGTEQSGIVVEADGTTVGGTTDADRNDVTGGGGAGVHVGAAKDVRVVGNAIGAVGGDGNAGPGVLVTDGARDTVVGLGRDAADVRGDCPAGCNTIAGNTGGGVRITSDAGPGNTARGNRYQENGGLDVDVEDGFETRATILDPDGPDAKNPPTSVQVAHRSGGGVVVSGVIPTPHPGDDAPSGVTVDVLASDQVFLSRIADAHVVATVRTGADGRFSATLPGPVQPAYGAIATYPDGTTTEPSQPCADRTNDGDPDTDGDTLCDNWESQGGGFDYDLDGRAELNLHALGGRPSQRDVFVEFDRMSGLGVQDSAVERVQTALAAGPDGGVHLHPLPGVSPTISETVPHRDVLAATERVSDDRGDVIDYVYGPKADNGPCSGFTGSEDDRRGSTCAVRVGALRTVFRYGLLADQLSPGWSGLADPARRAFVVGVGGAEEKGGNALKNGGIDVGLCGSFYSCQQIQTAGTIMHELGHTLGLSHGGADDVNRKPNYLSVMNYAFQWHNVLPGRPMDYSRRALPALDERALDETKPLFDPASQASARADGWSQTVVAALANDDKCHLFAQPFDTPWDADGDGKHSPSAAFGLHLATARGDERQCTDASQYRVLQGHDDWSAVSTALPQGAGGWASDEFERTSLRAAADDDDHVLVEELEAQGAAVDADHDGVPNGRDVCAATPNPKQEDADGDGIGDACLDFPQRDVSLTLDGRRTIPAGGTGEQVVRVANDWPVPATGVVVRVTADGLLAAPGKPSAGTVTGDEWRIPAVPARGAVTLPIAVSGEHRGWDASLTAEVTAAGEPDFDSTPGDGGDAEDDRAVKLLRVVAGAAPLQVRDVRVVERDSGDRELAVAFGRAGIEAGSVRYETADGTAKAGEDYVASEGRVDVEREDAAIRIPILGDTAREGDETFTVALTEPDGVIPTRNAFTVTIVDDDRDARTGELTYLSCLSAANGPLGTCPSTDARARDPRDLAAAPDGKTLYAADGRHLLTLSRDTRTAALAVAGCATVGGTGTAACPVLGAGEATEVDDVAVTPDGRQVYAAGETSEAGPQLLAFDRDASTGALRAGAAAVPVPEGARVVVAPDGKQVYAIGQTTSYARTRILTFGRDASTGALTPAGCQVEGPVAVDGCSPLDVRLDPSLRTAFSPDGRTLYLRSFDGLALLGRDPTTGALSTGPCVRDGQGACVPLRACANDSNTDACPPPPLAEAAGAGGVAVSRDGALVTVSSPTFALVRQYRRASNGDLTALGCLQDSGVDPLLERDCTAVDAPLGSIGTLTEGADGTDVYGATAGGGIVPLRRSGDTLVPGRCTEPQTDGTGGCSAGWDPQGASDLVAPAGGESVHGLVPLRLVGQASRHGIASYLRVQETEPGETPGPPVCADAATVAKPGKTVALALRCADAAGAPLTVSIVRGPQNGSLGTIAAGSVPYTSNVAFAGEDGVTFAARANDGRESAVATSRVTVGDAAPVCDAVAVSARIGEQQEVRLSCHDEEDDPLTLSIVDRPARGELGPIVDPDGRGGARTTYRSTSAGGTATFTYRATDGGGNASAPATVTVEVPTPAPPAPPTPPQPTPAPAPGGGTSGGACRGAGCSTNGNTADWRFFCDGRSTSSVGTCTGTVTVCPPQGNCGSTQRPHAAAAATRRKARKVKPYGSRRFTARAGTTATVRVRLNAKARRTLRRRGRLAVRVVEVVRLPDGALYRKTTKVTFRYKARRGRRGA